jgi:hypothetical protein
LTDVVEAGEIAPIVRGLSIQAGAQALLDLALERDGRDNITVVMLSVPWGNKQPRKLLDKFWQWAVLGLLVLILAALLISSLAWIIIRMLVPPGL